jgi:hypothetical protein
VARPADRALIEFADRPGTTGIAISGSFARDAENEWSDVDVNRYIAGTGVAEAVAPRWIGGRLVRVSSQTMEEAWAELDRPEVAVWAVLPLRAMRILVDREGEVVRLVGAALAFRWDAIAERARVWASRRLAKDAENVLKLRSAIDRVDESSILNAHLNLAQHCADAIAVGRGVLISTENRFHDEVRASAGPEWTRGQRSAYGLDGGDTIARARATCALYALTVAMLELDPEDRQVADRAMEVFA